MHVPLPLAVHTLLTLLLIALSHTVAASSKASCPAGYELRQQSSRWVCVHPAVETFTPPLPCESLEVDAKGNKDLCRGVNGKSTSPKCPPGFHLEVKVARDRCKKQQAEKTVPALNR
ncbi:hypothetical protein P886_3323 [Alteromonadaceae bacterium 2753L.S.0a.02]|nr:hypothetical protein P886_3323 [Alteromonadaceae bacterium 2753L.S.0a.02]